MPRKGRSNEEIVHALHQVEGGEKVTEVCRRLGVSGSSPPCASDLGIDD